MTYRSTTTSKNRDAKGAARLFWWNLSRRQKFARSLWTAPLCPALVEFGFPELPAHGFLVVAAFAAGVISALYHHRQWQLERLGALHPVLAPERTLDRWAHLSLALSTGATLGLCMVLRTFEPSLGSPLEAASSVVQLFGLSLVPMGAALGSALFAYKTLAERPRKRTSSACAVFALTGVLLTLAAPPLLGAVLLRAEARLERAERF